VLKSLKVSPAISFVYTENARTFTSKSKAMYISPYAYELLSVTLKSISVLKYPVRPTPTMVILNEAFTEIDGFIQSR